MRKVGNSSIIFDSVYLNETATIVGPKEYMGPLRYYYDHFYNNLDCNEDSWEKAEMRLQIDAINKIFDHNMTYLLDIKDKQIAQIRLDNPEANLQEIAQIYTEKFEKTISKSGVNHRIRKIKQIASEIKDDDNE